MSEEIGRHRRRRMSPEIVRRSDDDIALRPAQRDGNHVARHQIGAAHAEVEALGDDVEEPPFRDQVDMDPGKPLHELEDQRRQDLAGGIGIGIDAQRSRRDCLLRAHRLHRSMDVLQGRPDAVDEQAPGIRERDAARRPVEQAHAEMGFQLADDAAERRRGHAEFESGGAKRPAAGNCDDSLEILNCRSAHCPDCRHSTSKFIPVIGIREQA